MPAHNGGINGWPVHDTPVAVIDFETTGLCPGLDRVVEVSVLRCDPGGEPRLVLDTLVNPRRRMSATEIHGITDEDVADAPEFTDIAGDLLHALSGCVIAAYNVYFDLRFLEYELTRAGCRCTCPHFCLMYLRPMLGLGPKRSLQDACREHGIEHLDLHITSADVLASGRLYRVYLDAMRERALRTFGELACLRTYKFIQSFACIPITASTFPNIRRAGTFKSRTPIDLLAPPDPAREARHALGEYWEALKTVLYDLEITEDELAYVESKRRQFNLPDEQVRMLHARAYGMLISQVIDDQWLDDRECRKLRRAQACLQRLGWAPGD